jgi:hypothetical protein
MIEIVIGGLLFWTLLIALLVACEFSTVNENHWSFGWFLIFFAVLSYCSSFNAFAWMWHNPMATISWATLYIALGIGWGFVKWAFHLKNEKDKIESMLSTLKANYAGKQKDTGPVYKDTFTDYLEERGYISRATKNKTLISVWMFWWPFSVLWTSLHDVLRRFYDWAIEHYMFIFDKINHQIFGSLND